jgi:predicted N-acyltransferase
MVSTPDNFFFIDSINKINLDQWNECVGLDHPFTRFEFLSALENSNSASIKTGWKPCHYIEKNKDQKIIAICPLYIKSHSFGEYIFDHVWADAYHRHGLNYYPKLQSAIPFTPVTGERIIINNIVKDKSNKRIEILKRIIKKAEILNISSVHFNFINNSLEIKKVDINLLSRKGIQFHWKNNNYNNFEEFLKTLSSRKRKVIKKERQCLENNNLIVKKLTGDDINKEHWDFFYKCYMNTTGRKWGSTYLTKDFFYKIGKNFSDKILLFIAYNEDKMIASAINFLSSSHLYGRLWGSLYDIPYLHFELCYYQAIEYAILNKLKIVEAGAQGEHKLQRGYMPQNTWSLHWIKDQEFSKAIKQFLNNEVKLMSSQKKNLEDFSPFKKLN